MTGTAIITFDQMQSLAVSVAKSNLFGAKTPEQALTIMMLAQAEGRHPMSAAKDYDIINGKPAKKAEAMLRDFLAAGGKVEWHKLEDSGAEATFSHPQGGTVRIGWDEARMKRAEIANDKMYKKYPRAMYRSRCVSEGVRTVYPSATSGLYVPEEVRSFAKPAEKDMGKAQVVDEDVTAQMDRTETLKALCVKLGEPKLSLIDILAKCGVETADKMSAEDYESAVRMLNRKIAQQIASQA